MEFRTKIELEKSSFKINPTDKLLFVGSCFAENIGRRFVDNQFDAIVNPYGTMYNPASVGHTVERVEGRSPSPVLRTPSPLRARERLVIIPYGNPSQAIMCNFLLALRGEDARRAGEGLVSSFNSLFI